MNIAKSIISLVFTLIVLIGGCDRNRVRFSLTEEPMYGMGTRATVYFHLGSEKQVIYDTVLEAAGGLKYASGPIVSPDGNYVLFSCIGGECANLVLLDCTDQRDIQFLIDPTVINPDSENGGPVGARQPLWFPDSKRFLFFANFPADQDGPWIYSVESGTYRVCHKIRGHHPDVFPAPEWGKPGKSVVMYYDGKATEITIE